MWPGAMVCAMVTTNAFRQSGAASSPEKAPQDWLPSLGERTHGPFETEPTSAIGVVGEKGVQQLGRMALVSGHQVAVAIEGDGGCFGHYVARPRDMPKVRNVAWRRRPQPQLDAAERAYL
jgi:hypothetical protein